MSSPLHAPSQTEQGVMNIFLPPLRPPGAVKESSFRKLCIRCGKCVQICPHASLRLNSTFGSGRLLPYVDPSHSPCQLCMKCPPVCPTGALDPNCTQMEQVHMGHAHILKSLCHNYTNGTMCWTCYDRCPLRGQAIILKDGLVPAVTDACAGCGVCAHVCPTHAIEIVAESSAHIPADAAPTALKP